MNKRADWDTRYAAADLVWGAEPNRFVEEAFGDATPGRALDVACGEGRNAVWLARQGFEVTGVDFSTVAIERARERAAHEDVACTFVCADVTIWEPTRAGYDVVLISYLQVPMDDFREVLVRAHRALDEGGRLFGIGHALRNLDEGTGGPGDPAVLWDGPVVRAALEGAGFEVVALSEVERPVEGAERPAIDLRFDARRNVG